MIREYTGIVVRLSDKKLKDVLDIPVLDQEKIIKPDNLQMDVLGALN